MDGLFDDDVESALAALPPDFRAAVVLCDIEGLSYEEIADVLGLKLGTVRSRIHRGRTMLRKALAHRAPGAGRSRYSGPPSPRRRASPPRSADVADRVPRPRLLSGHLGSSVSALVDGQLDDEAAERAWEHVLHCPPCRRLVEHEGWVKRQLAQIAGTPHAATSRSDRLLGSLADLDPAAGSPGRTTQEIEDRGRTRRRAGHRPRRRRLRVRRGARAAPRSERAPLGSAVQAAPRPPRIGGADVDARPRPVAPAAAVHGRLRGWTLGAPTAASRTPTPSRPSVAHRRGAVRGPRVGCPGENGCRERARRRRP